MRIGAALLFGIVLAACVPTAPSPPATSPPTLAPPASSASSPPPTPAAAKPVSSRSPVSAPSPQPSAKPAAVASAVSSPSPAAAGNTTSAQTAVAPAGDAAHGQQVFMAVGCYACHGTVGQGASTGSKLAPNPLPFEAFQQQVRQPRQDMPRFAPSFVSDQDLGDIYAYLQSIPAGPAATEIPLLNR